MKAITLWQPWASLWSAGVKQNETRSWPTSHRGPLAIHAAKLPWQRVFDKLGVEEYRRFERVCVTNGLPLIWDLPRGCIVGTVDVFDCLPTDHFYRTELEDEFGDYSPGRWAWLGQNHRTIEPISCLGRQGLWTVPSIEAALLAGYGVTP